MVGGEQPRTDNEPSNQAARAHGVSFDRVYDRYAGTSLGLAAAIVQDRSAAETIVLESFVALARELRRGGSGCSDVGDRLMRDVRRRSIDRLRAQAGRTRVPQAGRAPELPYTSNGADDVFRNVSRADVLEALSRLPADVRDAIDLAFLRGCTRAEIAERLGVPAGTVNGRLRLGLHAVRSHVQAKRGTI